MENKMQVYNSHSLADKDSFQEIKIFKTFEYSKFKFHISNRDLRPNLVQNLKELIEKNGFVPLFFIIVDKYFCIKDGQHRFEAARLLKAPIYYVIVDKFDMKDVVDANSSRGNWWFKNYLKTYCNEGYDNYIVLK